MHTTALTWEDLEYEKEMGRMKRKNALQIRTYSTRLKEIQAKPKQSISHLSGEFCQPKQETSSK